MSEDPERDDGDEESPDSPPSESDSSAEPPAEEADENTSDEESPDDAEPTEAGTEPPADSGEESKDGGADREAPDGDEDVTEEPPDEAGEEVDVEEFSVPGMGRDADEGEAVESDGTDDGVDGDAGDATDGDTDESDEEGEERDIELIDESEVDEGVPPEEEDRTLPENSPGVGVDVPQQPLGEDEDEDDDLWGEGPESDQEMPLADHIEEMMRRLSVVFLVAGAVALTLLGLGQAVEALPTAVELIDALWNNAIPGAPEMEDRRPRLYGPLELILTKLKVTALAGLLIGLPVFVYETYLFMRPGLYRNERRYYLAAVPTSLVLGTIGMAFAHFVIIPAIMEYFTVYTQENIASVAYGLAETFNLILVLMAYMAVVFQIPLFIMLAIMMGLTTRLWLEDKRLLFWGGFLTVAFVINPDPTGMTPFIIAATMIVLYEGTLALLRWTGN